MDNNKTWVVYTVTEAIDIYWERSLEMIETFWFVRLDEGEMWTNVVWKWQKCHGVGRWKKVMETGIRFADILWCNDTVCCVVCRKAVSCWWLMWRECVTWPSSLVIGCSMLSASLPWPSYVTPPSTGHCYVLSHFPPSSMYSPSSSPTPLDLTLCRDPMTWPSYIPFQSINF